MVFLMDFFFFLAVLSMPNTLKELRALNVEKLGFMDLD